MQGIWLSSCSYPQAIQPIACEPWKLAVPVNRLRSSANATRLNIESSLWECLYPKGCFIMRNLFLIATAVATIACVANNKASACSLHLPTFEVTGFPISSHQAALLGGAHVEEQSATSTLTLAGMPASPHQIAVLTPRPKAMRTVQASADPTSVGLTATGFRSSTTIGADQASCSTD